MLFHFFVLWVFTFFFFFFLGGFYKTVSDSQIDGN